LPLEEAINGSLNKNILYDTDIVKPEKPKFSYIGAQAALDKNARDNLAVAKEMEKQGKANERKRNELAGKIQRVLDTRAVRPVGPQNESPAPARRPEGKDRGDVRPRPGISPEPGSQSLDQVKESDKPKQPLFSVAEPEKELTTEEEKQVETLKRKLDAHYLDARLQGKGLIPYLKSIKQTPISAFYLLQTQPSSGYKESPIHYQGQAAC